MKKKFVVVLAVVFAFSASLAVLSRKSDSAKQFMAANVEALSQNENVEALTQGESDAQSHPAGSVKNCYSKLVGWGFISTGDTNLNGEITVCGQTVKVQHTSKRKAKQIPYAVYSCEPLENNWCEKQGLYCGVQKLA